MWGKPNTPHHLQPRRGCKPTTLSSCRKRRRCLTMHNRWWSEAQPAGSGYLTIIRRRRCRTMLCHFEAHYYWCHLSAGCALVGLPAVKHGQAPPALVIFPRYVQSARETPHSAACLLECIAIRSYTPSSSNWRFLREVGGRMQASAEQMDMRCKDTPCKAIGVE